MASKSEGDLPQEDTITPNTPVSESSGDHTQFDSNTAAITTNNNNLFQNQATESLPALPPPPPNGGYGWVVAGATGLINAHSWGLNSAYGIFLAHYLSNDVFPGATTLQYAFVGSLSITCALLVSPLATMCVCKYGTRPAMMAGVIMEATSLVTASLATKIWHLFLTQGVLFGFGMGFLFVPSVAVIPQWFTTKRSLANGLASCGSGLGGLVYAFGTNTMIANLGLAWALRILGIIAFVINFSCTLLMRDRNKAVGSKVAAFEVSLFKRPEYLLFLTYGWFSVLGYVVLIFSLANYANDIGLNASQAALASAMFNLGQGIGRPLIGYFSDRTGRINMACATSFCTSIFAFAIWINAHNYGVLIFFSILEGIVGGTFWATVGPVTAEVVGLAHVPSGLNLMWLIVVLPCLFSEPIALEIVDHTGKYLGTQLWTGFMFLAAAICLFVLRGWKIGELEAIDKAVQDTAGTIEPEKVRTSELVRVQSRKAGRRAMLLECWKPAKV